SHPQITPRKYPNTRNVNHPHTQYFQPNHRSVHQVRPPPPPPPYLKPNPPILAEVTEGHPPCLKQPYSPPYASPSTLPTHPNQNPTAPLPGNEHPPTIYPKTFAQTVASTLENTFQQPWQSQNSEKNSTDYHISVHNLEPYIWFSPNRDSAEWLSCLENSLIGTFQPQRNDIKRINLWLQLVFNNPHVVCRLLSN
ncbi:hypothetical protein AMTR_s00037p00074630, partial [Amborella trichopoda]